MNLSKTHENYSFDWWTPAPWLDWVSATYKQKLWYDPCPQTWGPGSESGLESRWRRRNYVNHPGSRGGSTKWWDKCVDELMQGNDIIWCAFSYEQFRPMQPSPYHLPGWLVMPRARIGFVWGGPNMVKVDKKLVPLWEAPGEKIVRRHGEIAKSPSNWTVFWTSVEPADPPQECVVARTGA